MIRTTLPLALILVTALSACGAGGPVGNACLDSARGAGKTGTCQCIQRAADATLTGGDQRRAAKLMEDPEGVEKLRTRDRAFWRSYQRFGSAARDQCT